MLADHPDDPLFMSENTIEEQGPVTPRWIVLAMTRLNIFVYRLSKGRFMNRLGGGPICLVEMTGAKSGRKRTIPVMYVPDGDDVLVVASIGGAPKNPIWYGNLVTNPEVRIIQGGRTRTMKARQLDGVERDQAWPICVSHYPPYDEYKLRTNRQIPVFRCEPA